MKQVLRIIGAFAVIALHAAAFYYFISAPWVTGSNFLIFWASLALVGLSMSFMFYMGLLIKIPITGRYFTAIDIEQGGKLYEQLGIHVYKFILFHSPFVFLGKHLRAKNYKHSQLLELEQKMRISEFGHLVGFVMILAVTFPMCRRSWKFAAWLTFLNIIMHLYPIFLQRYNRMRINKLGPSLKPA